MRLAGRLLVVERVIAADYRQALSVLHLDLQMLVNLGGRERTEAEYRALFAASGFRLTLPRRSVMRESITSSKACQPKT